MKRRENRFSKWDAVEPGIYKFGLLVIFDDEYLLAIRRKDGNFPVPKPKTHINKKSSMRIPYQLMNSKKVLVVELLLEIFSAEEVKMDLNKEKLTKFPNKYLQMSCKRANDQR